MKNIICTTMLTVAAAVAQEKPPPRAREAVQIEVDRKSVCIATSASAFVTILDANTRLLSQRMTPELAAVVAAQITVQWFLDQLASCLAN